MPRLSTLVTSMKLRDVVPTSIAKWFIVWTAVGALFSLQLRWHYGMPWLSSVFWGFADWYLWSFLALAIFIGARTFRRLGWPVRNRALAYAFAAPVVAAFHVILTMILGGADGVPQNLGWVDYFSALYAKKLTLNMLTFGALAAIGELLAKRQERAAPPTQRVSFLAKRGNVSQMIAPEDIIWGEVAGNYVDLHTPNGIWPVQKTLTQIIEQLPQEEFLKVNRSRFMRLACLRSVYSKAGQLTVNLSDGTKLQVARRQQALARKVIRARGTK